MDKDKGNFCVNTQHFPVPMEVRAAEHAIIRCGQPGPGVQRSVPGLCVFHLNPESFSALCPSANSSPLQS
uniref:Uncharacterized protein n=1 Tax=Knipowitschia caucasica TaxID=637954 RepID=A0AAV2ITE4_KNICA